MKEVLEFIEAGINILEDIDSNEQWVATTKKGIKKMLTCYKGDPKREEEIFISSDFNSWFLK